MEEPRGEGSIDRNTRSPGARAWSCLHGHCSMLRHMWLLSTHVSTSPWGREVSFTWICADRTHCVHCFAVCLLWWHSICIAMLLVLDIYCYIVTTTHNRAGRHLLVFHVWTALGFIPSLGVVSKYQWLQLQRVLPSLTVFATIYTSTCHAWECEMIHHIPIGWICLSLIVREVVEPFLIFVRFVWEILSRSGSWRHSSNFGSVVSKFYFWWLSQ